MIRLRSDGYETRLLWARQPSKKDNQLRQMAIFLLQCPRYGNIFLGYQDKSKRYQRIGMCFYCVRSLS